MPSIHSIKPQNLTRQPATPAQQDYWKEIIRFGDDDNFPLRLARLVQNSPTASSCIDTKADFIAGDGFSDSTLSDRIMNGRNERLGDIHNINADAYATFEGFALEIKYNGHGLISEVFNIPFEYCRFAPPDSKGVITKIKYNPYFGTGQYKPEFTKTYDVYNPDKKIVLAQQNRDKTKYCGQILYVATTGPLSRFYPAPKYYSAQYWMAVDEAIGGFHKNNVDNNFFQSVLLKMIGRENDPSSHPEDVKWNADNTNYELDPTKTVGMRFNIVMQQFTGWQNAGNIMTLWAEMKEAMPELQAFPSNTNSELFKTLQELATENITRATKTPAILANIQSGASLGGDGNAIRASVKLMQQRVVKIQAMFERVYKDILSHMDQPYTGDVKILHYNPFPEMEKLDPLIWNSLSPESQKSWIKKNTDFEIIENKTVQSNAVTPETLKAQAALRGSVGGVQGVLGIQQSVVAKTTTPESALSILTIIYGFTDREARQLLGQPQPDPAQSAPANQFSNVFYADYPEGAKKSAQRALDFRLKNNSNCGGKAGWDMTQQIIDGKPLSFKMIKRIHNFLVKNSSFSDSIFSDSCEAVLFAGWGGKEMLNWAKSKIDSINE